MSIFRDLKISLSGNYGALIRLILINVIIFLVVNITYNLLGLSGNEYEAGIFLEWISLSGNWIQAIKHFWTIPGYAFIHIDFFHILSNMLMFYFLGRIFVDALGGTRLIGTYLLGGLSGGILYLLVSPLLRHGDASYLIGASAAVMAVVVAIAVLKPDYTVFPFGIAMKLKWLALISFIITTLIELGGNTGGKVAHIGGALFGYGYGYLLSQGKRPLEGFMQLWARGKRSSLRVEHRRKLNDEDYINHKTVIRRRIDEILDKISHSGYDSLSREEREFLQKNHDKT